MLIVGAFFRLIRWPNLFFIALAQSLFYYAILLPGFQTVGLKNTLSPNMFFFLVLSCLFIAAAGYIINDYFDLNIDRVNKPGKMVVEKIIKRRWAIIWHGLLSGLGILIGIYISFSIHNPIIWISHCAAVALLLFYSTTFKRKLLIGNIIVSFLSSWVLLVLYLCEFRLHTFVHPIYHQVLSRIFKFAILYAGFAFILSLVREVVKDIEDMEGDASYKCRTMPIVWGVDVSKVFAGTWLVVLILSMAILQFYVLQYKWWWVVVYSVLFVILPLLYILRNLYRARAQEDFHELSGDIKLVMFTGILSMALFLIF